MPTDVDPLLPQTPPAPEISGQGFSSQKIPTSEEVAYDDAPASKDDLDLHRHEPSDGVDRGSVTYRDYGTVAGAEDRSDKDGDSSEPNEKSGVATANAALGQITSIFAFVVGLALIIVWVIPGGWRFGEGNGNGPDPLPIPGHSSPQSSLQARAEKILKATPLMDTHVDLPILLRIQYKNHINTEGFHKKFEEGGMPGHVDIPRLRKGLVGGFFWSTFVTCPANSSWDFSEETYSSAVSQTLAQIDVARRLQSQYPSIFSSPTNPLSTSLAAFHANRSLISPLSIEGLHQLSPTAPLSSLRLYYTLGVRAASLNWNCHNIASDAALIADGDPAVEDPNTFKTIVAAPNRPGGLSEKGRQIIREMNRLGMIVDLSHTSYWTQVSVLSDSTSRAPVIYSHSSAFALCPHQRNVHDDVLELVKKTGSVVQVNFYPEFISCVAGSDNMTLPSFYEPNSTIIQLARHITYIGEKIGYEHVGFGSDFDGIEIEPANMTSVADYPRLVETLLAPPFSVSDHDVALVVGGNLLRVWEAVERVRDDMAAEGILPEEDFIESP